MGDYYVLGIIPHVIACTKEIHGHTNGTESNDWLFITNEVLYYLYPAVIGLALIFTILNSIVSAKMVTDSHECYLTGFNVASTILVLSSAMIHLPAYVPFADHWDYYAMDMWNAVPYIMVVEDWCLYTCTWLLVTAVVERVGHAMCGQWHASFGRVHGILASLLIVVVCFVCTLPQYWEYELTEYSDSDDDYNCTRLVVAPLDSVVKEANGYVTQYYYYHWVIMIFSVAFPYLVLPIILPPMCCRKMHTYSALQANGHISTYTDGYASKDYMKDERNFNHLLGAIVMIYLLLSAPRNTVRVLHHPPFFMQLCEDKLLTDTLVILFDIIFYFMFFILFFFNLCCYPKFRMTLRSLRCCCCKD